MGVRTIFFDHKVATQKSGLLGVMKLDLHFLMIIIIKNIIVYLHASPCTSLN